MREIHQVNLDERMLKRICLAISVLGLLIIYLVEATGTVPYIRVSDITAGDVGSYIRACGTIERKYVSSGGDIFFDLLDGSTIRVVIFRDIIAPLSAGWMDDQKNICIEGRVKLYKGDLEIIGERIIRYSRALS